jgi:hypothetical protein
MSHPPNIIIASLDSSELVKMPIRANILVKAERGIGL